MLQVFWFFRVSLFYVGIAVATVLFSLLSLLIVPLSTNTRYKIITSWSRYFIWWGRTICDLEYQVNGRENIPLTPCVILANHQSAWETIFMQVLLPQQSWILKRELLCIPFFGWGLALLWPIAIDRRNKFSAKYIIEQGKIRLANQRWILVFPEGTRVKIGDNKPYSRTGAALAIAANVPILPIAHNAGIYWPRGWWIKKPGVIKVCIGPTIATAGKTALDITNQAKQWITDTQRHL